MPVVGSRSLVQVVESAILASDVNHALCPHRAPNICAPAPGAYLYQRKNKMASRQRQPYARIEGLPSSRKEIHLQRRHHRPMEESRTRLAQKSIGTSAVRASSSILYIFVSHACLVLHIADSSSWNHLCTKLCVVRFSLLPRTKSLSKAASRPPPRTKVSRCTPCQQLCLSMLQCVVLLLLYVSRCSTARPREVRSCCCTSFLLLEEGSIVSGLLQPPSFPSREWCLLRLLLADVASWCLRLCYDACIADAKVETSV